MRLAILGATGGIGAHLLNWGAGRRAARLVNKPGTGQYRVRPDSPPRGGRSIARADVAHFMAAALTEAAWPHAAPALAY